MHAIRPKVQAVWLGGYFLVVEDFEGIQKALSLKTKTLYCESMVIPGKVSRRRQHHGHTSSWSNPSNTARTSSCTVSATQVVDGHGRSLNFDGLMEALYRSKPTLAIVI